MTGHPPQNVVAGHTKKTRTYDMTAVQAYCEAQPSLHHKRGLVH